MSEGSCTRAWEVSRPLVKAATIACRLRFAMQFVGDSKLLVDCLMDICLNFGVKVVM